MKKIILILILLIFISSVSAVELCEYNGLNTKFDYPPAAEGKKIEYADEKFIQMVDDKVATKLEQIKGLRCLEFADFYHGQFSGDIENLKDLVNLKVLNLHTNPEVYGDICVFSDMTKLKSLKFAFDEQVYGGISCLKDLNLDTFAMTYAKISGDLSDLSHMTNLKALYLSGTDVKGDVSALSGLTNLEELTLADTEVYGAEFHGDLASLDNLKKLKKVALYNIDVTNCEHFTKMHPNIEGGCSEESKSTIRSTSIESEKIIGKEPIVYTLRDVPEDEKPRGSPDEGPPEECMKDGKFIGDDECRKITEPQKIETKKGFFQKIIDFFRKLFGAKTRLGPSDEIDYYPQKRGGVKKELCEDDKRYIQMQVPDKPVLSIPFDINDYSTKYWGFVPFCAELRNGQIHGAMDFELKPDSKVYAAESGVVESTQVGKMEGSGEVIQIKGDGFNLDYSGLKNIQFKVGDKVDKGDHIGDAVLIPHGEHHVHMGLVVGEKQECPLKYMDDEFRKAFKEMFAKSEYSSQTSAPCACNCESMEKEWW